MKFKYIILYFCAFWVAMSIVAIVLEKQAIIRAATDINNTISLAADMAITTVSTSDEFFRANVIEDYNGIGRTLIKPYKVYVPSSDGSGYVLKLLYEHIAEDVWGVDLNTAIYDDYGDNLGVGVSSAKIFQFMFSKGDANKDYHISSSAAPAISPFGLYLQKMGYSKDLGSTKIPLSEVIYMEQNDDGTWELKYGCIPALLRMGNDIPEANLYDTYGTNWVYELTDGGLDAAYENNVGKRIGWEMPSIVTDETTGKNYKYDSLFTQIAKWNNFDSTSKESSVLNGNNYFTTPLSIGVTYLDPDLVSFCFVNNMDLLMRAKYLEDESRIDKAALHFIEEDAGVGLPSNGMVADRYVSNYDEIVKKYNIINDGIFGFVKGDNSADFYLQSYKNSSNVHSTSTEIEYVCIDMFNADGNPEVEEILKQVFSAYKGDSLKGTLADSVSEYLRNQSTDIDPVTGNKPIHKYIVVAKIDFYADIIVPYSTTIFKDFSSRYFKDSSGRYMDGGLDSSGKIMDESNFMELPYDKEKDANGEENRISTITGNAMYHYTTYFAVAP